MLTKELLAAYIYGVAAEEGMISTPEDAKTLESKIRAWDLETFNRVLKQRSASLKDMASGKKQGPFDASCYNSQAETIDEIVNSLSSILGSNIALERDAS